MSRLRSVRSSKQGQRPLLLTTCLLAASALVVTGVLASSANRFIERAIGSGLPSFAPVFQVPAGSTVVTVQSPRAVPGDVLMIRAQVAELRTGSPGAQPGAPTGVLPTTGLTRLSPTKAASPGNHPAVTLSVSRSSAQPSAGGRPRGDASDDGNHSHGGDVHGKDGHGHSKGAHPEDR